MTKKTSKSLSRVESQVNSVEFEDLVHPLSRAPLDTYAVTKDTEMIKALGVIIERDWPTIAGDVYATALLYNFKNKLSSVIKISAAQYHSVTDTLTAIHVILLKGDVKSLIMPEDSWFEGVAMHKVDDYLNHLDSFKNQKSRMYDFIKYFASFAKHNKYAYIYVSDNWISLSSIESAVKTGIIKSGLLQRFKAKTTTTNQNEEIN